MRPDPRLPLFLLSLAPLAAQNTTVVPSAYATTEASSSVTTPFGQSGSTRTMQLYQNSTVAVTQMTITRLALRGNGGSTAAAKNNVDLEIRMSTSTADVYRPSATFASNHGANVVVVFNRKLTNLPALTAATPPPFNTVFPLDTPIAYDGAQGHLVIDWMVHGQLAGAYPLDTSTSTAATSSAIGTACRGATQAAAGGTATSDSTVLTFNLSGGIPNAQSFHLLGVAQLPVPIPLPLGGCPLLQDFALITQRPVTATGTATISYPLRFEYRGATVYGQYLVVDNGLTQLLASQSHRVTIGGYDAQSRVFGSSATAVSGSIAVGTGAVTQLTY